MYAHQPDPAGRIILEGDPLEVLSSFGTPMLELWLKMAVLLIIGTLVITLSALRFRKRLG